MKFEIFLYRICLIAKKSKRKIDGTNRFPKSLSKQILRLLPYCYSLGETRYKMKSSLMVKQRAHWNKCLVGAIGGLSLCCKGKQGTRALSRSCIVRYEVYPFYQLVSIPLVRAGIRFGAVFYIKRQR
ncbi:hypothetical protein AAG906_039608 [Vitis piasezkii]